MQNNNVYIGIDVGSTTCKIVFIDEYSNIIYKKYERIYSQPIKYTLDALNDIKLEGYNISGIGVTGSARKIISELLNTKNVKNEITAQTVGCLHIVPDVNTIIEIGGEDSKIIFLKDGNFTDFRMNKVCAAGTGAFIDWQATKLGMTLEQFDQLAMSSKNDIEISGKCAVFIESSIIKHQRNAVSMQDIAMGISKAIVNNYLADLCAGKNINGPVVFQGGVALLKCMQKAFEDALNLRVHVPENCEYMGAIGMALYSKNNDNQVIGDFNLKIKNDDISTRNIICKDCESKCELNIISSNGKNLYLHGSKCGKYNYSINLTNVIE